MAPGTVQKVIPGPGLAVGEALIVVRCDRGLTTEFVGQADLFSRDDTVRVNVTTAASTSEAEKYRSALEKIAAVTPDHLSPFHRDAVQIALEALGRPPGRNGRA